MKPRAPRVPAAYIKFLIAECERLGIDMPELADRAGVAVSTIYDAQKGSGTEATAKAIRSVLVNCGWHIAPPVPPPGLEWSAPHPYLLANLARRRFDSGLSLVEAAEAADFAFIDIVDYESGAKHVPQGRLEKLAALYGCTVPQFFEVPTLRAGPPMVFVVPHPDAPDLMPDDVLEAVGMFDYLHKKYGDRRRVSYRGLESGES